MKLYMPITIDLYNIYPLRVLNLQQNNVGRGALITFTAAGAVVVPESEALYVYAKKSDGTAVYNTCTLKGNQIQVDFDEQMTVESGILQVELQMVDTSGNSITTPIFQVNVQKSNIDYQKVTSQDSFRALVTTLAEVQELKKTGLKGDPGEAATIQIGTVTASDPGSDPEVTNSGTEQDAVLNFVLPRGIQGPTGPKGDPGTANAATVAYDNSTSGATETNAQDAFDKLYGDIASLTENMVPSYNSVNALYNSAADVSVQQIIIEQDGWIQGFSKTSSTPGTPFVRLRINNIDVWEAHAPTGAYRYAWTPLFRVKKGDKIVYTLTSETSDGSKQIRLYVS